MTKVAAAAAESDKSSRQKFDLEERTAHFGEDVIAFAKRIPKTAVTYKANSSALAQALVPTIVKLTMPFQRRSSITR